MQEKLFGSKIVLRPIHPPLCLWFHASLFLTKDRTQLVEGVSKVGQCLLIGNYAEKEKMGWGGGDRFGFVNFKRGRECNKDGKAIGQNYHMKCQNAHEHTNSKEQRTQYA